jgi:hypothetical protein
MLWGGVYVRSLLGHHLYCSLVWSQTGKLRGAKKLVRGTRARGASYCESCDATVIEPIAPTD